MENNNKKEKPKWELLDNVDLDHNPCEKCGGKCCVGMQIEQGRYIPGVTEQSINWANIHEGIEAYVYDTPLGKLWGIRIPGSKCKHLQEDGKCGVEGTKEKPTACKEYIGFSPAGPYEKCELAKALLREDKVPYVDWMKQLWPNGLPLNEWRKKLGMILKIKPIIKK